ncbi:MAG: 5-deoxy-glucuronate isomerase [Oscillospiraceae bacterium]|nr:5-deoxy-glucuronate isomerase [Oscillospiraceae bacterium]
MSKEFSYPEFDNGVKVLTRAGDPVNDMMMNITVHRLKAGRRLTLRQPEEEMAVLLVLGEVTFSWEGKLHRGKRTSFIEEGPYCLHVSRGIEVTVIAHADSEVLVQTTENDRDFGDIFYRPVDCRDDIFGLDVYENKMKRTVRTVFDYRNAPYSNMVNGEVVNHQGGWSSYTPHSHPQPEVYYYRYEHSEGFGACFIGEDVYKIKDGSVAAIPGGKTHPQVTAPAFPMYYCWMIRHLEGNPWTDRDVDPRYTWIDARMK